MTVLQGHKIPNKSRNLHLYLGAIQSFIIVLCNYTNDLITFRIYYKTFFHIIFYKPDFGYPVDALWFYYSETF